MHSANSQCDLWLRPQSICCCVHVSAGARAPTVRVCVCVCRYLGRSGA